MLECYTSSTSSNICCWYHFNLGALSIRKVQRYAVVSTHAIYTLLQLASVPQAQRSSTTHTSAPERDTKVAPAAVAAALTSVVLLQPGGPYSSIPRGADRPNAVKAAL